jgi:DNA-binding transcriptional LysR family regulator
VLRVALPSTYGARRVIPVLPAFLDRRPLLRIELMMSDRYENLIAEGADVALRLGEQPDSSFVARRLESAASFRRSPVLPCAAGRAENSRRSCAA